MRISSCLFLLVVTSSPAFAGILYDNGPYSGRGEALGISSGFWLSDSFVLTGDSVVSGFTFATWQTNTSVSSVDWSITSSYNSGTNYGSATGAAVSSSVLCTGCGYEGGYIITSNSVSGLDVALGAGTYWLTLQNAVAGSTVYWDDNDGPATAVWSEVGGLRGFAGLDGNNSETFQILGADAGSGAPEPATLMLFVPGLLAIAGVLRRRLIDCPR